jgi:hypothetical protein
MAKPENKSATVQVTVSISEQQAEILDQIAASGLMGQNRADVARRFIDDAVITTLRDPLFELKRNKPNKN